jgi:hypothetical protein
MPQRHMVAMWEQPVRPTPPGGYRTKFGEAGPQDATEVTLTDLDEPGFELTFSAFGVSNANRVRSLLEDALTHLETEDGQRGFVHPVIRVTPESYYHSGQGREIHHFGYVIVDWLRDDGALLSKNPAPPKVDGPDEGEPAPWDAEGAD